MGREQETKRTDLVDNTLQLFQLLRSVRYDEIDNIVPEVLRVGSFLIIADFERVTATDETNKTAGACVERSHDREYADRKANERK